MLSLEPQRLELRISGDDKAEERQELSAPSGTVIDLTNGTDGVLRFGIEGSTVEIAAGSKRSVPVLRPGLHTVRTLAGKSLAVLTVEGAPRTGHALHAGTGLWRFQMEPGEEAAAELCYAFSFVDRAGNRTESAPRTVTLAERQRR